MELQKIINEFLDVIDFKLCSITDDSINIQNKRNTDELNKILILPIDYTSDDNLRVFRSSKLTNDCYYISALNTKYSKVPFSKNGIDSFTISIKKDNDNDYFSSELYHDDSLYVTHIGKIFGHNSLSYRKCDDNGIIDIFYGLNNNNRNLEISSHCFPSFDTRIYISENATNTQHTAVLVVKENDQEVYRQEIKDNEIDNYFQALAYKLKNIIEQANNGIRTLNNNIFEMIFEYHKGVAEFLNIVNNSIDNNEVIDILFEKYFSNITLSKNIETEMSHQRKLTLPDSRKSIPKREE